MNLAQFIIEGSVSGVSPASARGFDAAKGETLSFRLENGASNRVRSFSIQVYDPTNTNSPLCSKGAPVLSLVGKTTGQQVDAASPTASITTAMPSSGIHSWMVVGTVNGGRDENGIEHEDYRFARLVTLRSPVGIRKIVAGESSEYSPDTWVEAYNEAISIFTLASADGRFVLASMQPGSRQGTAALATGNSFTASAPCATNNRIHRTTWALRLKVGGVHYICDYYAETLRDGAGAISKLEGKLLGKTPPAGVTIAWAYAAGVHQLNVSNTTGAAIEVWAAPSDLIEDIS